jgi:hypothetical protein
MPKRLWKIDKFEGGLNNVADPRDIKDNEAAVIQNMSVDRVGKLRTMGAVAAHDTSTFAAGPAGGTANEDVEPGRGLFTFRSDYVFAGYDGTGATNTGTSNINGVAGANTGDFLVFSANGKTASDSDTSVDIYSKANNNWSNGLRKIDVSTDKDEPLEFYGAGGAVRIASAAPVPDNCIVKWFGYIKQSRFLKTDGSTATSASDTWDGWFACDAGLRPPVSGVLNLPSVDAIFRTPLTHTQWLSDADGFNVEIKRLTGKGTWPSKKYNVGISWIYDGNQESLVTQIDLASGADIGSLDLSGVSSAALTVRIRIYNDDDVAVDEDTNAQPDPNRLNPRITGCRVYVQEVGTQVSGDDAVAATGHPWQVLCTASFAGSGGDTAWGGFPYTSTSAGAKVVAEWTSGTGTETDEVSYLDVHVPDPPPDTYETINGFSGFIPSISFDATGMGYFTSQVANGRAFVANVTHRDIKGQQRRYGDRILYSEYNKFDTFPATNTIDIGVNDGDEFRALDSYGDRLLAFKRNKLYIINIGSGADVDWFLESEHENKGVTHPSSVTHTDYGVAFCNHFGTFLYNGREIVELSIPLIKEDTSGDMDDWYTFVTLNTTVTGDHAPSIGYIKRTKQLLIMANSDGSAHSGNVFLYDFKTNSWTFGLDIFTDGNKYTNFDYDWTGELLVGADDASANLTFKRWEDAPTAVGSQVYTTKDIDFGEPGIIKKIYKIYMTYKAGATQAHPLEYSINGEESFTDTSTSTGTITTDAGDSTTLPTASAWDVAAFSLASPLSCQSLQLRLNPPSSGTFEVNDIAIDYRPVYKRVS